MEFVMLPPESPRPEDGQFVVFIADPVVRLGSTGTDQQRLELSKSASATSTAVQRLTYRPWD